MSDVVAAPVAVPALMSALVCDGTLELRTDIPVPAPGRDEALIRVRLAGICGTDLEILRGYKGYRGIIGHEFVGEVVRSADESWIGQRVCGEINVSCGRCDQCISERRSHCRNRSVVGILNRPGAFADFLCLPSLNLHRVRDEISDRSAVFIEPLAAAFEILEQVPIDERCRIAVLGDGRLGVLCAQVLRVTGAQVTLYGKHAAKIARIAALGIHARTDPETDRGQLDVVVEATGSASGLDTAVALLRPRGILVLKSTFAGSTSVDLSAVPVNELTIVGSRCGPFPRAIAALSDRSVDIEPLIDACYPLSDGLAAMRHAVAPNIFKVLLSTS